MKKKKKSYQKYLESWYKIINLIYNNFIGCSYNYGWIIWFFSII